MDRMFADYDDVIKRVQAAIEEVTTWLETQGPENAAKFKSILMLSPTVQSKAIERIPQGDFKRYVTFVAEMERRNREFNNA